jgi:hypothetical protein
VSKLRPADYVAGIGGLVLLVSLWLHWYGIDFRVLLPPGQRAGVLNVLTTRTGSFDGNAWQVFSVLDIVFCLIALVAIGVPVTAATTTSPAKPIAFAILGTVFSALAVVLILYRIANQPGSNAIIAVKPGAWIGLAGAVIALVGSYLAMADEHTPGATPPDIPIRPAP